MDKRKTGTSPFVGLFLATALSAALAGCGGEGAGTTADGGDSGSGGGSGPGQSTERKMGTSTGDDFIEGAISITSGTLSAGGTTSLSVNVVDGTNTLITESVDVSFNSPCFANELARFTVDDQNDNSVTTTTGSARIEYTAAGCAGSDLITATALVDGKELNASGSISVASAEIGSIDFDEATPKDIAFDGSGTSERPSKSTVSFRVMDRNGNGIRGKTVSFRLSTSVGGITLSSDSEVTNTDGVVTTTVNAGTVTTTVRVTASVTADDDTVISTTSESINVNIGIADQNSVSLSLSVFGPNAANYDGVEVDVTARAADKNNNFVPNGTIINFVSSFGAIPGSCTTNNGACTVKWTSQGLRPGDGMVTILARTVGEESFRDANPTNGRFDVSELATVTQLSDAYLDRNWNGSRDADEEFYDFGDDGAFTVADALFNGTNCTTAASTAGHCASLIEVRDDARLQMASDTLTVAINGTTVVQDGRLVNTVAVTAGNAFDVVVEDEYGNCPPTGTTFTLTSPTGGTVVGKSSYTMGNVSLCQGTNTNADSARTYRFRVDATTPGQPGTLELDVNTAGTSGVGSAFTIPFSFN